MIPVYIINRNRLTTTQKMVDYLSAIDELELTIIDNDSTYEPLLEWYSTCGIRVLHPDPTNGGLLSPWHCGINHSLTDYFMITDSDLDLSAVPVDFPEVLRSGLDKYDDIKKVGLSLEVDDLPDEFPLKDYVWHYEQRYWATRRDSMFFDAKIASTMAMHRGRRSQFCYGPGLRADRPYCARHVPWYMTPDTVTEEDRFYFQNANANMSTALAQLRRCRLGHVLGIDDPTY